MVILTLVFVYSLITDPGSAGMVGSLIHSP
jgi:hypothetical protein